MRKIMHKNLYMVTALLLLGACVSIVLVILYGL